jgi:hypothetical protein|tara:strand:- start:426 stop:1010 length:585 start_codon:yes stop_codon:yes gene_type:complete
MLITAIDEKQDLFAIENLINSDLISDLHKVPLECVPFSKMEWQETIPRRKLAQMPGTVFSKIHENINATKDIIANTIGQSVKQIETAFWYDQEGFDFTPHIDNPGVDKVMQIYLSDCPNTGTVFYNVTGDDVIVKEDAQAWHYEGPIPPVDVRKEFEFKVNKGYLMLNGKHQLHGVPNKIGKGDVRLSVYCWIN